MSAAPEPVGADPLSADDLEIIRCSMADLWWTFHPIDARRALATIDDLRARLAQVTEERDRLAGGAR